MDYQHHQTVLDKNIVDEEEFVANDENALERSTGDYTEEGLYFIVKYKLWNKTNKVFFFIISCICLFV